MREAHVTPSNENKEITRFIGTPPPYDARSHFHGPLLKVRDARACYFQYCIVIAPAPLIERRISGTTATLFFLERGNERGFEVSCNGVSGFLGS